MSEPSFDPTLFRFLRDLSENNERDWFNANKATYESDVREPALAFVRAMGERLPEVAPHLTAIDKKSGGSLLRIYRDTRFSKDKTPYKTNVGIQFRHDAGKDVHAPGLYVHLALDEVSAGVGTWGSSKEDLARIRDKIANESERWTAIAESLSAYRRYGECLKRVPRGYPKDHPMAEELKWKSFIFIKEANHDIATEPGFIDWCLDFLGEAEEMMVFLCEAIDQPYM